MIKVEKMSYSFPEKDLYKKISFTIEDNQHCAFIGTNGTGKSTLVDMLRDPEEYMYEGKIKIAPNIRMGYVSQFPQPEEMGDTTVFQYLSIPFLKLQEEVNQVCEEMGTAEDIEPLMEKYQGLLDISEAMDGDNYESNIGKQLKTANLTQQKEMPMGKLSGGEYKLVSIMREMLIKPNLLIMDEPDVYLDFDNLNALMELINGYTGTMLVITHNRYLLNHCFNKILHLEDTDIQEFDGNYIDYNFNLLLRKIEQQERNAKDEAEIQRNRQVVERLRAEATKVDSATKGRSLHARVSLLERLEARKIKAPFVEIREPEIHLSTTQPLENKDVPALKLKDYQAQFDELLLEHVDFEIAPTDKVAIVGPNGTGKTTMLRDIYKNENPAIQLDDAVKLAFLSQMQGEMLNEENTVIEEFEPLGFASEAEIKEYLAGYCFDEELLSSEIGVLSGGEKNLLQLAKIAKGDANFLLLDEPTSHLDIYAQVALEKAVEAYNGGILMVSHDFYTIVNCVDYVLYVEDKTIRKMSVRKFRKMIYADHFNLNYLENEQKKKELEARIGKALLASDYETAGKIAEELEQVIKLLK